jgi:hypothetical protein
VEFEALARGTNAMNNMNKMTDQNEEEPLTYEVSDEALEVATCTGKEKANTFTQWICTAIYFCPGP